MQSLGHQLGENESNAGQISAWAAQACNKTKLDWIDGNGEHDWNSRGGLFSGERRIKRTGFNQVHFPSDELACQGGQSIVLGIRPAVLNVDVVAVDEASLPEAADEFFPVADISVRRRRREVTNHRHRLLLRKRRDRVNKRCNA